MLNTVSFISVYCDMNLSIKFILQILTFLEFFLQYLITHISLFYNLPITQ